MDMDYIYLKLEDIIQDIGKMMFFMDLELPMIKMEKFLIKDNG